MYNANYNPNLPLIRGLKGDFGVIIDTGEVLNVTSNPRLACYLARSLDLPMPRANCCAELVHSACRGSVRAGTDGLAARRRYPAVHGVIHITA